MFKTVLKTALLMAPIAFATSAFAVDSGDAAFALLSKYKTESQQTDYIKLRKFITPTDAMEIDRTFSELYGEPKVTREGLKVWEITNSKGSGAPQTTLMCGADKNGKFFISADRRGPKARGEGTRSKAERANNVIKRTKTKTASRRLSDEKD